MIWNKLFGKKEELWEYGVCGSNRARRHIKNRNVQFVLWEAGEQGYKENYWHNFDSSWWPEFKLTIKTEKI